MPRSVHRLKGRPTAVVREEILVARGVTKSYGTVQALRGVTLEVLEGEILGLLGPNGAGKTTFLSICAGLKRADSGTLTIAGREVSRQPRLAKGIVGFAPQEVGLYLTFTGRQNLSFFARIQGVNKKDLDDEVAQVAARFHLTELLDRKCGELSGGERRRLHAAVAVVGRPRLLLLDEPTAGVDVLTRDAVLESVRELAKSGSSVIYTTHYMEEAERLCDRLAVINSGEVLAVGEPSALLESRDAPATVRVSCSNGRAASRLAVLLRDAGAKRCEGRIEVSTVDVAKTVHMVLKCAQRHGIPVSDLAIDRRSLDALVRDILAQPAKRKEGTKSTGRERVRPR